MRTVQEILREYDKRSLIYHFFYKHPINIEEITDLPPDLTVEGLKQRAHEKLSKYIDRLCTMEVTPSKNGEEILFLYRKTEDTESLLVHKDDILSKGTDATAYAYMLSPQSEAVGWYVSDAPFTQRNLADLLVDLLYELSFFGFKQEGLQDFIDSLQESEEEYKRGESVPAEEFFKEMEEEYGIEPSIPHTEKEEELHTVYLQASVAYSDESLRHEKEELLKILKNEGNEDTPKSIIEESGIAPVRKFGRLKGKIHMADDFN